jgi:hypothetical protein
MPVENDLPNVHFMIIPSFSTNPTTPSELQLKSGSNVESKISLNVCNSVSEETDNTNTNSKTKIYFDKKSGDIVEKKLVFDGKQYKTEEEKEQSDSNLLNIDEIPNISL